MSAPAAADGLTLVVRRRIRADAARLFRAWTDPAELVRWWGPRGVVCDGAEIDLRAGGAYRIVNRIPDGSVVVISGVFEAIEPPHRLVYTWAVAPGPTERVTVSFTADGDATEVRIVHERIANEDTRRSHANGWTGCLEGLAAHVDASSLP